MTTPVALFYSHGRDFSREG